MKNLMEISTYPAMQHLGWTLLHSVWQGILCTALVVLLLRWIPSQRSSIRYAVSSLGLILLFIMSLGTFAYISGTASAIEIPTRELIFSITSTSTLVAQPTTILSLREMAILFIEQNISIIVLTWSIGAFLFSLRICAGYWYITEIRKNALPLEIEWQRRIQVMAASLGVSNIVSVAESHLIQAPVVIGYFKPLILIPVGMFSGLTTEQVESIFIHELIHIRRGDFLVNIIQSLLEAIFFFNPFVWMLSSIIRREREHCCDDNVIMFQGNPLAYARALATLEEVRLNGPALAMSLAQNKNQLLNRIKRIMERSSDRYPGREKFVPVILLVLGLMCASWLSIGPVNERMFERSVGNEAHATIQADTSKKEKTSRHQRTSVTATEDSSSEDEMVYIYRNDHDIEEPIDAIPPIDPVPFTDFHFDMPDVPAAVDINIPEIAEFPEFPEFDFEHHFSYDTLGPHGRSAEWMEFSQEFEKNFKEKFSDFYEKHEDELKEIMDKVQKVHAQVDNDLETQLRLLNDQHFQMAAVDMAKEAKKLAEQAKEWQKQNEVQLRELQMDVRSMENHRKAIDAKLGKELFKDGYLSEGEKINQIHVSDSEIEINGKKIKDKDYEKYKALLGDIALGPKLH